MMLSHILEECFSNFFLAYHCHGTKPVRVPLSTGNVSAYFQDAGLPGSFTVETSNFTVVTFLIERH